MQYPSFDPQSADTPLTDEELQTFDDLLQRLPADGAMNIEGLDGYLTALVAGPVSPATLPSADWLPAVWGGDGEGTAPFPSQRQRKNATVLVLRHLQHLACQLRDRADEWEPVFSVAETDERDWVNAQDWCAGFLQAVDLAPEAWEPLWDDPSLGPRLVAIALLGGDGGPEQQEDLESPEVIDDLSRSVPDAVLALYDRLHRAPQS